MRILRALRGILNLFRFFRFNEFSAKLNLLNLFRFNRFNAKFLAQSLIIFLPFCAVIFSACGYAPISKYSRTAIGERIFVEIKTSLRYPQNSVELKDNLNNALITRLGAQIVPKENAETTLTAEITEASFYPVAENLTGFATSYRCDVILTITYQNKNGILRILQHRGRYNFSLGSSSIITDSVRTNAISIAANNAIDGIIAQIGALSALNKPQSKNIESSEIESGEIKSNDIESGEQKSTAPQKSTKSTKSKKSDSIKKQNSSQSKKNK